ncbi:MAG: branched-chain amino acid ABC transporter permease [Candidatus Dormibacteria bacterium]
MSRLQRMGVALGALFVAALLPRLLPEILPGMQRLTWTTASAVAVLFGFGILSVVILTGYAGQVSLCQATFMGISAFTTASLVNHGINFFVAAVGGVLASFLLGVIVGIPALRLKGITLAIVTVGVALGFDDYFFKDKAFDWFNGGVGGWSIDGASLFGVDLSNLKFETLVNAYWVIIAVFAVVAILVVNLHDSGSGRRLRAIRDSEVAAATMGIDLTRFKLLAFGFAAAVAGIGGAFFPLIQGTVTAQPFNFFVSLQFAAVAVLVGIRFVPAAAVGGMFMALVPQVLNAVQGAFKVEISGNWFNAALGALLILQMITLPDGVWGQWAEGMEKLIGRTTHLPVPEPSRVVTS